MKQQTHSSNQPSTSLWKDFLSLFFPHTCLVCAQGLVQGEDWLCLRCIRRLPRTDYIGLAENPIGAKFYGRLPIQRATALLKFRKKGITQKLLHALKYKNQPEIGVQLGRLIGQEIHAHWHRIGIIIPVPLHPSRLRERGYNQSVQFAAGISDVLHIPFSDNLSIRTVKTSTQTKKGVLDRWKNVSDVFMIQDTAFVKDKHVLLVDDVITTGATLEACGASIVAAGCASLSIACIAEAQ